MVVSEASYYFWFWLPNQHLTEYIVTCQRGGVSNKPPGLQAATRHGASDHLVRSQVDYVKYLDRANLVITTRKLKKKERTIHWTRFTKTGWIWHVTILSRATQTWASRSRGRSLLKFRSRSLHSFKVRSRSLGYEAEARFFVEKQGLWQIQSFDKSRSRSQAPKIVGSRSLDPKKDGFGPCLVPPWLAPESMVALG